MDNSKSKYKVKYLFILWWKMYVRFDISFHTAQQVRGNGVSQNRGTSVCCCYLQQHNQNTGNNFNSMFWTRVIWTFNCTNLTGKTATYGIIKLTNFTRSCHLISLSKHSSHFTDTIDFIALPYQKPLACFRTCITLYMYALTREQLINKGDFSWNSRYENHATGNHISFILFNSLLSII
jgi:hypothetical protein